MPRPMKHAQNEPLLRAALEGLELQRQRIDQHLGEVRSMLGAGPARRGRPPATKTANNNGGGPRRTLSAAARKKISLAQKRRWAEHRAATNGAGE